MVQSRQTTDSTNYLACSVQGSCLFLRGHGRLCVGTLGSIFSVVTKVAGCPTIRSAIVDLEHCLYLDSTVMGCLVGLHRQLLGRGSVYLYKTNPAVQELLNTLGINKLLKTAADETVFPDTMLRLEAIEKVDHNELLRAHELLCGLSAENQNRFETLNRVLKQYNQAK